MRCMGGAKAEHTAPRRSRKTDVVKTHVNWCGLQTSEVERMDAVVVVVVVHVDVEGAMVSRLSHNRWIQQYASDQRGKNV